MQMKTETEKPYTLKNIDAFVEKHKKDGQLTYCHEVLSICRYYEWYWNVSELSIMNGFEALYDIGCAYGLQGDIIRQNGMKYVGVDNQPGKHMYEKDGVSYIFNEYPFKINAARNSIAVSHLCIGWNCFFPLPEEKEETYRQLAEDFSTVILHIPEEEIPRIDKYFKRHFDLNMTESQVGLDDPLVVTYLFTNIEEEHYE